MEVRQMALTHFFYAEMVGIAQVQTRAKEAA